ncbi:hypothetical protein VNO77_08588 [Canavalia gladiata]|uniref:Uncharacterized protein n=1 Tax=Canavalia gladiata TaxID=3824 RepID=A0AAN9M8K9_CANGL
MRVPIMRKLRWTCRDPCEDTGYTPMDSCSKGWGRRAVENTRSQNKVGASISSGGPREGEQERWNDLILESHHVPCQGSWQGMLKRERTYMRKPYPICFVDTTKQSHARAMQLSHVSP